MSEIFEYHNRVLLIKLIVEGKIVGNATRGRKRTELLHDTMKGRL